MTTRYDENYFGDAFFGVLHETGHGLYDQGLPAEHFGTPLGEPSRSASTKRSRACGRTSSAAAASFWEFFLPKAQAFPRSSSRTSSIDQWYFAINDVRPCFIRTESDEATYNLHILLRFELEQAMLTGELAVDDVPAAWNERMKKYLGLTPPDDASGCLQDIHWSGGAIGYFPTYTLGNLYAAQFFEQARKDLGDLDAMFARGEFAAAARLAAREHPPPRQALHRPRAGQARHRQRAFRRTAPQPPPPQSVRALRRLNQ